MDQKNSNIQKYKSISTGQPCNAAQYAAELVCIRKREKENKGNLEFKFWNKSQKQEYETQIRAAWNLIDKFDEKSLIRYLNSPSGNNVYALGFLHKSKKFVLLLSFVEAGVKKTFEELKEQEKIEKKVIEIEKVDTFNRKSRPVNNKFSKLRKIDEKNSSKE
jgi:hypothetical protein